VSPPMTRARDLLHSLADVAAELRNRYRRLRDPVAHARSLGVKVGEDCRLIGVSFGSEPYLVRLGDHVSATTTSFITHDGGAWVFRDRRPDGDLIAPIAVGNNVFLGSAVTVMPGVSIGDNVVVGAGAVVTRDLPSNCVAVGVPAKPIRSLDEYWKAIEPRLMPTKLLGSDEKRDFLLRHFAR
jgi:acetyltransferase-like isoleucine patch superfamily enzyme